MKENYEPDLQKSEMSFLSRSYERHFNERPYLHHQCYLFITKTTKERMARQSNFSTLCRGHIVPKEIKDKETVARFLDAVEQFARIINDSGYISLRKLTDDEITGTERTTALSDCPLTEVTADFPLPLQLACCCPATISITSMYS